MHVQNEAKRLKGLNLERRRVMVSDTERLLKLADELNARVGNKLETKSSTGDLKDAEAIAKLAHSVRDLMRQVYDPQPEVRPWR